MSFASLVSLKQCQVLRKSDILLESIQITAAPVITRQPSAAATLIIFISGCTIGSGSVIVNGTVGGAADSETFTFAVNGFKEGIKEFTVITSMTTVGFVGEPTVGNIEIKAQTPGGDPIYQEYEIFAAMNCWIDFNRGGVTIIIPGAVVTEVSKLFCEHVPAIPLAENDIVVYDGTRYLVDYIEKVSSKAEAIHHLELKIKKEA